VPEQYVFNSEAEKIFYEKLDGLHDKYVYHLLLSGVAARGTHIESIKMTKNLNANKKYCQRVMGGLVNIKPQVVARLVKNSITRLECIFTHINDNENLNHLYMIQNVMDWPLFGSFSCQIWYLGETKLTQVRKHWDE
jgi:hypothetical protein